MLRIVGLFLLAALSALAQITIGPIPVTGSGAWVDGGYSEGDIYEPESCLEVWGSDASDSVFLSACAGSEPLPDCAGYFAICEVTADGVRYGPGDVELSFGQNAGDIYIYSGRQPIETIEITYGELTMAPSSYVDYSVAVTGGPGGDITFTGSGFAAPVPEPRTGLLVLTGLGACGFFAWRKRRA